MVSARPTIAAHAPRRAETRVRKRVAAYKTDSIGQGPQAIELRRNSRGADDGHRYVMWGGIVEGADVGEGERKRQHQRGDQHEPDGPRRGCGVRDQRSRNFFSERMST